MIEGPKRLSETELGELGKGLAAAKEQLPSAERLSHMAARLAQAGISLPEASTPRTSNGEGAKPAPEGLGPLTKTVIGVVGVGGVVLGIALAGERTRVPAPTPIAPQIAAPLSSPSVGVSEPTRPQELT